jgi:hypothetical protein
VRALAAAVGTFLLGAASVGAMALVIDQYLPPGFVNVGTVLGCVLSVLATVAVFVFLNPRWQLIIIDPVSADSDSILHIKHRRAWWPVWFIYEVITPAGQLIGRFQKSLFGSLFRTRWDGFDADRRHVIQALSSKTFLPQSWAQFLGLSRWSFSFYRVRDNRLEEECVGEYRRRLSVRGKATLELPSTLDETTSRQLALAIALVLHAKGPN